MQRDVVERRLDPNGLQFSENSVALRSVFKKDVVHVVGRVTVHWNLCCGKSKLLSLPSKNVIVSLICRSTLLENAIGVLELAYEVGREQVRHSERRADVLPCVLIYPSAKEGPPVGSLVIDRPGPVHIRLVIDGERPTLATGNVLGFVKAHRREAPEAPKWLIAIGPEQPMSVDFNNFDRSPEVGSPDIDV